MNHVMIGRPFPVRGGVFERTHFTDVVPKAFPAKAAPGRNSGC